MYCSALLVYCVCVCLCFCVYVNVNIIRGSSIIINTDSKYFNYTIMMSYGEHNVTKKHLYIKCLDEGLHVIKPTCMLVISTDSFVRLCAHSFARSDKHFKSNLFGSLVDRTNKTWKAMLRGTECGGCIINGFHKEKNLSTWQVIHDQWLDTESNQHGNFN